MYTCDRAFRIQWKLLLGASIFVGIFSAVYEYYGHGIRSKAMIFAFLYPLLTGFGPAVALAYLEVMKKIPYRSGIRFGMNLLYSGIATLTVGSIASGVVEIYGTTNYLLKYYTFAGLAFLVIGLFTAAIALVKAVNDAERKEDDGSLQDFLIE